MNLPTERAILVFLLLSVGLITLPHVNHLPVTLSLFFYCLLGWRFIGIWKNHYLPNRWQTFLLTLAGLGLLYSQYNGLFGRDAGTHLFVIALGLKLLEIKQKRDLYLINYLAFIVASTQFLYQQSILMAGYILSVCIVLLATLILLNSYKPSIPSALKTASIIILQALPLTIILFVLFPRVEIKRWSILDQPTGTLSGLSDHLEPGAISRLSLSDELVFRVKFKGDLPPINQRYWRGPVYSYTDGQRWTESKQLFFARYQDSLRVSGKAYHYTLMMEPQRQHWVFALDMPVKFPPTLKQTPLYQLINPKHPDKRAEYAITSYPQFNTGYITQGEQSLNLQLPTPPSARIHQLVSQLDGFKHPPQQFIQHLLHYFREQDFHYTLSPPLMQKNPIETFLFETRYGFCSHYATAFVYLMRVAGIPARVIGGYQGGELNKVGGFLEIKQAHAHAWAEVWLKGQGWTRVDPTAAIAPERIEQNLDVDLQVASHRINFSPMFPPSQAAQWLKNIKQLWGNTEYQWQRWVINYSATQQNLFFSGLGIEGIKSVMYWLLTLIILITSILAALILRTRATVTSKELQYYQKYCAKLAKIGINKQTAETAQQFAQRVQQQRPDIAKAVRQITELFITLRYKKTPKKQDMQRLKQTVNQFKPGLK